MVFNRLSPIKFFSELCRRYTSYKLGCTNYINQGTRLIHTTFQCYKLDDRRVRQSFANKDEGTEGEGTVSIDSLVQSRSDMFPVENTPNMIFNGIQFSKIPVCNIKVSKNNTILSLNDGVTGESKLFRTCGMEGFKNTRKGTNIAAQATAITFATQAKQRGFATIRVKIKGLGPGRMSAIKGLQMAGMNIISITDNTPVSWHPPRPRKQRRL